MSIRRPGSPTCWPGSPTTRSPTWARCCRGIGVAPLRSTAPPDGGGTSSRDHDQPCRGNPRRRGRALVGSVTEIEPEDGCLWIHGTDNQETVAFTPNGMEYLREMLPEYKRSRSPPRA